MSLLSFIQAANALPHISAFCAADGIYCVDLALTDGTSEALLDGPLTPAQAEEFSHWFEAYACDNGLAFTDGASPMASHIVRAVADLAKQHGLTVSTEYPANHNWA